MTGRDMRRTKRRRNAGDKTNSGELQKKRDIITGERKGEGKEGRRNMEWVKEETRN